LLYPQLSWEEFGGSFLSLMAYLSPKGRIGENSMPVKQRPCPGTRNGVLRDSSDMVNIARLPEPQFPEDATLRPSERYLKPMPHHALKSGLLQCNLRGVERFLVKEFKGMSGAPKSLYNVQQGRTWDRLTGTSHVPYGDTGPVLAVGVTPHQGGRESRPQGEGGQVIGHSRAERCA
jgi:hypothetical protein